MSGEITYEFVSAVQRNPATSEYLEALFILYNIKRFSPL